MPDEYGDYECPYSRQAFREIERVESRLGDGVRFAFRHFPLPQIHPHADRMSATCTHRNTIGCCDSSPHQHASGHARSSGHPIARSAEPGEDWSSCYVDNLAFVVTRS